MTPRRGLRLDQDDDAPLVVRGQHCVTRGGLKREANRLVETLVSRSARRAIVCSDDPADILRSVDACDRAGVDLYVAHTTIPRPHVADLCVHHDIDFWIDGDERSVKNLDATTTATSDAGRVFTMTSGTAGRPKIAMHSLESLLGRARVSGTGEGGRWLLTYQPTGFAGIQVALSAVQEPNGVIVAAESRTPAAFYEAAVSGGVSLISGTPTFWRSFLMVASPGALELRQITLGGEATDQATLDRLKHTFPRARITHTYASTEAGVVYAVHDGRAGFPAAWLDDPSRRIQLRVRDGFLQIKSPLAMRRYVSETDQPFLDEGWLATADRCEVKGDRAYVVGRDDSTINVAGSKVYPLEIENFLLAQPGIVDAVVYSVPNPVSGFLVGADVVLTKGADPAATRSAIFASCRAGLASYQVPRVLKIVETIRVGASGKKG